MKRVLIFEAFVECLQHEGGRKQMQHKACKNHKPASHVGRRQLVLELEIDLLLSSAHPRVVLVIVVQIAGKNEQTASECENTWIVCTSALKKNVKQYMQPQCVLVKYTM